MTTDTDLVPAPTDDQLLAAVRAYHEQLPKTGRDGRPVRCIAASEQDQSVPSGVRNPLWEIVRLLPNSPFDDLFGGRVLRPGGHMLTELLCAQGADFAERYRQCEPFTRPELCKRYSWAIASPGDIAWIRNVLQGRGLVEVGAGSGYWAWQLRQTGVDVVAYDPHPPGPDNGYVRGGPYTQVLPGDHTEALAHTDRVLFLCWPGYGAGWAHELLSVWGGQTVIYCGEPEDGCTADRDFYKLLDADWHEIDGCGLHVQWDGIHDTLTAHQRRT